MSTFDIFPYPIKLEILQRVLDLKSVISMTQVCREWHQLVHNDIIWQPLFKQDFAQWHIDHDTTCSHPLYWMKLYIDMHVKGWQWDTNAKAPQITLSNSQQTAVLLPDNHYRYGVRTSRAINVNEKGRHYFEIIVQRLPDASLDFEVDFDKGANISLGIGIANKDFNVSNSTQGWVAENEGIGYYNDGTIYALGQAYFDTFNQYKKIKFRIGDLVGLLVDCNEKKVSFFINQTVVTEAITMEGESLYPTLILCGGVPVSATITSCKLKYPAFFPTEKQKKVLLVREATQLITQKNYDEALKKIDESLELDPNYSNAIKWKGQLYQSQGKWEEGLACFNKFLELKPGLSAYNSRGLFYEAWANVQPDKYNLALEDYNEVVRLSPHVATGYYNRACTYDHMKMYDKALEEFTLALDREALDPVLWHDRADVYLRLERFNEAIADYTRAIEVDPKYAAAYNDRGYSYKKLGDLEKAIEDYTMSIQIDPENSFAYTNRAAAFEANGELEKALEDYNTSIKMDPKNETSHNNRAFLYNTMELYEKAIEDCDKAIGILINRPNPKCHRALALANLDRLEEALADCNSAIALDASYVRSFIHRAFVYFKMGKTRDALNDCQIVLERDPEGFPDLYFVRALIDISMGEKLAAKENLEKSLSILHKPRAFSIPRIQKTLQSLK